MYGVSIHHERVEMWVGCVTINVNIVNVDAPHVRHGALDVVGAPVTKKNPIMSPWNSAGWRIIGTQCVRFSSCCAVHCSAVSIHERANDGKVTGLCQASVGFIGNDGMRPPVCGSCVGTRVTASALYTVEAAS